MTRSLQEFASPSLQIDLNTNVWSPLSLTTWGIVAFRSPTAPRDVPGPWHNKARRNA